MGFRRGKSTKYFLNLEKSRAKQKTMSKVATGSGISSNLKTILQEQSKYFKKLYQSDEHVTFHLCYDLNVHISDAQKQEMNSDITLDEIKSSLKESKQNKSPGPDGIPVDFYQMFWPKLLLQSIIFELINQIVKCKCIHESARKGIISLIPKKGRDQLYVRNWRPIILLNADYKLFSKILANRLKSILDTIIHTDQSGFMVGRSIAQNLKKICDTITYTQNHKIDALILSLDFEKAFDRLEYSSLYAALNAFGVPDSYIEMVRILFTDFRLCTVNGGYYSEWFTPTRGVFQGNCISPYAFISIIEILAINLRANRNIKGIRINDVINLLCQFADDMQIFTEHSQNSLEGIVAELTDFEGIFGMKINYDKTMIYRIGSLKNSQAKLYVSRKFQWTSEPLTILGVSISNDEIDDHVKTYQKLYVKLRVYCIPGKRETYLSAERFKC